MVGWPEIFIYLLGVRFPPYNSEIIIFRGGGKIPLIKYYTIVGWGLTLTFNLNLSLNLKLALSLNLSFLNLNFKLKLQLNI